MPRDVTCGCGKMYRIPDEKFGKKMRCKKCSRVIVVDAASSEDWDFAAIGDSVAEPEEAVAKLPPPKRRLPTSLARKKQRESMEEDLLPDLSTSAAGDDELPRPVLPPRRTKKGQSTRVESMPDGTPRPHREQTPFHEVIAPAVLAFVGLGIILAMAFTAAPAGVPVAFWLAFRFGMIVVSLVITFGALFLASIVVEAEYGYISTGLLKVTAIVLTQAWVGDILDRVPVPFFGSIVAWLATYAMFKYFFELDDMEAISSMVVVRFVHWIVGVFLFLTLVTLFFAGRNIDLPMGDGDPDEAIEVQEEQIDVMPGGDMGGADLPEADADAKPEGNDSET